MSDPAIEIHESDGSLLASIRSFEGKTAREVVQAVADERCFFTDDESNTVVFPDAVVPAGVSGKDVEPFVGLLIEKHSRQISQRALNCITNTELGLVTTLHGLSSFAKLAKNEESSFTLQKIPSHVHYFWRTADETDFALRPVHFDVQRDLIMYQFEPDSGGNTPDIPTATLSQSSPDKGSAIIFLHWSPEVSVEGHILIDHGSVLGKSTEGSGIFIASLKSHGGACGGGVFFSTSGHLAGIHQGMMHESEKDSKTGRDSVARLRQDLEELKGEKEEGFSFFWNPSN